MDKIEAKKILTGSITDDNSLYDLGWYLNWNKGKESATLDGEFTAKELMAIAWWIENTK